MNSEFCIFLQEKLQQCLKNFQTSLSEEIRDLRKNVHQLELKHLTLHDQYVSTVQDVEKMKNKIAKIATTSKEVPYVFDAPNKNAWFAGRLTEIKELASLLGQLDDEITSKSKVNIAAVCGLGGVGKTSLAIEYAHQKKDYYTGGVYWFSGEDDAKFENSVYDLATRLGTQSDSFTHTLSATLAIISRNENKWLLILDNMDQLDLSANIVKLVSGPWQNGTSGHLLITTRRKPTAVTNDIQYLDERGCLSLKCFDIDEGKKFIFHRVGIVHDEEIDTATEKLVLELGGLPLALEQAGAYIKSLRCTVSQYLEQYEKQRLRLLNQHKATPVSVYESPERLVVRTTWYLNFEHIKLMLDGGKAVSRFLNASAFLNPNEIQKDIINVGEPPVEDKEFNEYIKTTLGQHQVLKMLTDFSLFQETLSSNLSVHHLVQEVIQNNLNQEQREVQSLTDAIRLVHYAFKSCPSPDELLSSKKQGRPSIISGEQSRFYNWHKLCLHSYELVKHLKRVIKSDVDREKIFQPETARIVYECAIHLSANSKHDEAKEVDNFAKDIFYLAIRQQVPASSIFPHIIPLPELVRRHIQYCCNLPATLHSKNECRDEVASEQLDEMRKKGNVLFKKGLYNDALNMYSDAIDLSSKNTISLDVTLLSNRASAYLKLGQYEEALQDAEEYILQRPKCWKGYARKALALFEMNCLQDAYVAASLTYYYKPNIFHDFEPFKRTFGSSLKRRLLVCGNISDFSKALWCVKLLNFEQNQTPNNSEDLPVIILERNDYLVSINTIHSCLFGCGGKPNALPIEDCILAGTESDCSVTFDDDIHVVFVKAFIAYNVKFHSRNTNCHFLRGSTVKLSHCCFESSNNHGTSFCCFGQLRADFCTFHDCTMGGLLVVGNAEIQNSEFFGNAVALEVREEGGLVVKKCKMYGNDQGLLIGPRAKKCVVEDCELYDNKRGGIYVTDCVPGVVIKGNRIWDNDEPGVTVMDSLNVSILENEIFSNSDWGVYITRDSQALVEANKIQKNQSGGVALKAAVKTSVIKHNDISFNSGPGIYEEGVLTKRRENKLQGNKEERNQSTAQSEAKLCYCCKKSKTNLQKCCKCYTAQYCGKECQKNDWESHKQECGRLLSDGSIVLDYVKRPIMTGHLHPNEQLSQSRAPGLQPVGPRHCNPPNTRTRFIVKMSAGININEGCIENPAYEVNLYNRSLTIDGKLLDDAKQIYEIVRKYGTMGQLNSYWKKLFMWVQGPKDGKLRVFINEFPPYQQW